LRSLGPVDPLKRFPPTASDGSIGLAVEGLWPGVRRGLPGCFFSECVRGQPPLLDRFRARSASASSSAAERLAGAEVSGGSAAKDGGRGVGVLGVSAAAWLPEGWMRKRRRYCRSQRGPQNQPAPVRKVPPEARSSSSVSPAMVERQPVQCCPVGSCCFSARERIHFASTTTPSPHSAGERWSVPLRRTSESPCSRRLHPPGL
jgi:hypothetical protein